MQGFTLKPFLIAISLMALIYNPPMTAQDLEPIALSPEWLDKIESLAPDKPAEHPTAERRLLVFSLHTGYEHWVIPHTESVVRILASKTGMATCTLTRDISYFEADKLKDFDAILLNNTCPRTDNRDIFFDILSTESGLDEKTARNRAAKLEANLIEFVRDGGGLVLLHGGTTMQNNSMAFSEMTGGSFDFHPRQQPIKVKLAEPGHTLLTAFNGQGFTHVDEPYFFKNAYRAKNFRPLLYMETSELEGLERGHEDPIRYISWIKPYGQGRVFVCAASHNAQSFENTSLLAFLADGMQYALGDLEVDDAPGSTNRN